MFYESVVNEKREELRNAVRDLAAAHRVRGQIEAPGVRGFAPSKKSQRAAIKLELTAAFALMAAGERLKRAEGIAARAAAG